jgi:membrane protein implicated in regulation of membrane protease activity
MHMPLARIPHPARATVVPVFVVMTGVPGAAVTVKVNVLGGSVDVPSLTVKRKLSLVVLRPIIRKHALPAIAGADEMIGIKAMEGAPGTVLEQVTQESGLVRVDGELWTARVYDATQVLEPGERIRVIEIRGTTALVWRDEFEDVEVLDEP